MSRSCFRGCGVLHVHAPGTQGDSHIVDASVIGYGFGNPRSIRNGQTIGDLFVGAEPKAEQKGVAATGAYRFDDLAQEAHAVFRCAAIGIVAVIRRRREELPDQIAVSAMNLDAVMASPLEVVRRMSECFHEHADFVFIESVRWERVAWRPDRRGCHWRKFGFAADELPAEMQDLADHHHTVRADHVSALLQPL